MEFTCNTKPLVDALELGIIDSNVTDFNQRSKIALLTFTEDYLKVNVESTAIKTEVEIIGRGTYGDTYSIFVNCATFKKLLRTIDSGTISFKSIENGIVIKADQSQFTLPAMLEAQDAELTAPVGITEDAEEIPYNKDNWRYIKANQLYAVATSYVHPVFTYVWVGDSGDVLTGDIDVSLFTASDGNSLGTTCLLSISIINLLTSLPDGTKLYKVGSDFVAVVTTDEFTYISQITPTYETNETVGNYNSNTILGVMSHPVEYVQVPSHVITKYLNQAELLATSKTPVVVFDVSGDDVSIYNDTINCSISAVANGSSKYHLTFLLSNLRKVLSNYGETIVSIGSLTNGDEITGIVIWNDTLTTAIAGVEQ